MDKKRPLLRSTEALTGFGLVISGICAQAAGFQNVFTMALIPFGVGLILSDVISYLHQVVRVRVRVRRDRD